MENKVEDINDQKSTKKGIAAYIENLFRKFKTIGHALFLLPIAALYVFCIGGALAPGIYLYKWIAPLLHDYSLFAQSFYLGMVCALGFILFVFTLIFIVPLCNLPFLPFVKPYRGPWFALESLPWYYHNALTYLVRYTVLDLITPTPLNILFYKMMGMKIGKGVMINSSNISDPCLIILEDYVTIGGSAFLMAHYGMKGFLVIDKTVLKKGAMIGLNAHLLGGVTVGEKATVGPNATVLPKTNIPAGEKFGVASN